jgi:hypothetical protein
MTIRMIAGLLVLMGLFVGKIEAGDPVRGSPDGPHRAGHPGKVAWWAMPSDNGHYTGYKVGGGAVMCGHEPTVDEGTWGWDYWGCVCPKKIVLGWYHGLKSQGGVGAYRTTGKNLSSESTP